MLLWQQQLLKLLQIQVLQLHHQKPATSETVKNPYGLEALWREGDLVAKSTLFILVLMSIGTWYIIISKLLQQGKVKRQGKEAENISGRQLRLIMLQKV